MLLLSLLLCLCSMLSKEQGITVLAVCLCYEYFITNKVSQALRCSCCEFINFFSPQEHFEINVISSEGPHSRPCFLLVPLFPITLTSIGCIPCISHDSKGQNNES